MCLHFANAETYDYPLEKDTKFVLSLDSNARNLPHVMYGLIQGLLLQALVFYFPQFPRRYTKLKMLSCATLTKYWYSKFKL